jgi:Fms-interacting protein/Thoc5
MVTENILSADIAGRIPQAPKFRVPLECISFKLPSPAKGYTEMAVEDLITDPTLRPLLLTSQDTLRQTLEILTLLSENHTNRPSQEAQLNLSRQQKALFSLLAQLRGHNRRAAFGVRNAKQETAEARQEVDRLLLQLQNLYYEQRHLMGEIGGCEGYE